MRCIRTVQLADAIFDELDRIAEQWMGVAGFKEVDSRDLLSFDLYHDTRVARAEAAGEAN